MVLGRENMKDELFGPVIFSYSIQEATRDGVLVRVEDLFGGAGHAVFSHLTVNLLRKHYFVDAKPNKAAIIDLLQEATRQVRLAVFSKPDEWLVTFKTELPDGQQGAIWAERNELGKFTLLLPEDH